MSLDSPLPLTILIIRHAEKPGETWPGSGLTSGGKEDEKSLVLRGWERAGAWAVLFGTSLGAESYPKPSAIYAANPEAISLDETSQRPFQTVIPLSERLGITPIITYSVGQEVQLVSEVLHSSGVERYATYSPFPIGTTEVVKSGSWSNIRMYPWISTG
jgi:hypothetical protein